jgi:hypothetical protein
MRDLANARRSVRVVRGWMLVLVAILLAAANAGCVDLELSSDFRQDASALHSVELTIENTALDQLERISGQDLSLILDSTEAPAATAEAIGLDFERIESENLTGARVSREIVDSSNLGATFDDMLTSLPVEGFEIPVGAVSGTFASDDDEYRLDMTISSDVLFASVQGQIENAPVNPGQVLDFSYIATFPGEVRETNGEKVGDNQVRWDLPLSGETQMTAVSGTERGSGSLLFFALLALIVLLTALAVGYLVLRRRGRRTVTGGG